MIMALAGRPNVGKSSLFNRFIGRRSSIVWDRPGVTRDLIPGEWKVEGRAAIEVWDLAGVGKKGLSIRDLRKEESSKIDMVLLVVDGSEPLTTEDRECIDAVRALGKPVVVAVNKKDKKSFREFSSDILEFFSEAIVPISAETKEGLQDLEEKLLSFIPFEPFVETQKFDKNRRVLILGRPNVGKSSLLNTISGRPISFVAEEAGTTRDAISCQITKRGKHWEFVDTAGVRKKPKIYGRKADPVEIFSVEKSLGELKRSNYALFVVEAQKDGSLAGQDRKLLHLIRAGLTPTLILVNKWDLVRSEWNEKQYRDNLKDQLGDLNFLPVLFVSAKTGFRIEKIFQVLTEMEHSIRQIPTSQLNRWLRDLFATRSPKVSRKGHAGPQGRTATQYLQFRYMVHTSLRPMSFQIFCNAPQAVSQEDERFITNQLRTHFGLIGVPIKLIFRKKAQ